MTGRILEELRQTRPLASTESEAYLNIMRTSDELAGEVASLLKPHGLTGATFNVLRILRGAGKAGSTCGQIGERLLTRVPDVTRLVDRLEEAGLLERRRCKEDRRVVYVRILPKGQRILAKLDEPVVDLHRRQLGGLSRQELETLITLLEKVRSTRPTSSLDAGADAEKASKRSTR